jgi:two-component system chemotaxis response regulator CheY
MSYKFERLSVLVIEDTAPLRKLLTSVLVTLGVGIIYTADDGEQGFDVFCENKPDIVITDWLMNPTDGLDLVDKIRNDPKSPNRMVPIIIMTGYGAMPKVTEARDQGVTEFLVKPFSASDLARRIAYVINKPRDFVDSEGFFGPDRRRHNDENYAGPRRRSRDRNPAFSKPPGESRDKS